MSSGQKPRTPEYFPRMKDHAAGRRARNTVSLDIIPSFAAFAAAVRSIGKTFAQFAVGFRAAFAFQTRRSDYALTLQPSVLGHLNAGVLRGAEPSLIILDETGTADAADGTD